MIVNEKTPLSRAMYWELKRQAPEGIPVYQQEILEPDVWHILDGDKDDFLIYDRCSRLAFHIQLPYSFLHLPYIEAAVHYTSSRDYCGNCSWYHLNNSQEMSNTASAGLMTTEATTRHRDENQEVPNHNHEGKNQQGLITERTAHHHSNHRRNSDRKTLGLSSTHQPALHSQILHPHKEQAGES